MGALLSIIKKEAIHIVRDRRTLIITLVMPLVLLLLFGFAISTEVNDVKVAVVTDRHNDYTRDLIERLRVNEYYSFEGVVSQSEVETMMRRGDVDAALILHEDNGRFRSQIIVDASNPTFAQSAVAYIRGAVGDRSDSHIVTSVLYNPQLKSAYNFVPGILGMIFILICGIMTSVSIVREKESGSMNLMLVSPVNNLSVIIGKLVPYFILSCIILGVMLLMAYTVLGLPVSATILSVIGVSLIYILLSLSIGLLVSMLVDTQVSALIVSAVLFMTPVIMLSGMIFPIDNMPRVLQYVSCAIPARWYVAAMRKLMIQQLEFRYVLQEVGILLTMTLLLFGVQIKKFHAKR